MKSVVMEGIYVEAIYGSRSDAGRTGAHLRVRGQRVKLKLAW
jgi:hypothetical protein